MEVCSLGDDVTFSNVTLSVFTNFDPFNSNSSFVILCFSANLVSLICFKASLSFLTLISNEMVNPLRALLSSYIFVYGAETGAFFVRGRGVGLYSSLNSSAWWRNYLVFIFLNNLFNTLKSCCNWSFHRLLFYFLFTRVVTLENICHYTVYT